MVYRDEELVQNYLRRAVNYIKSNKSLEEVFELILINGELWQHSVNVAKVSTQIGIYFRFPEEDILNLAIGGLLHDIGKLKIPNSILYKPSRLSAEEFKVIQTHCIEGTKLIACEGISGTVFDIVLHHHEKLDGTGYPDNLKEINIYTQVVTVADIFSALSEHRCYHDGMSVNGAFQFIKEFTNINKKFVAILPEIILD